MKSEAPHFRILYLVIPTIKLLTLDHHATIDRLGEPNR